MKFYVEEIADGILVTFRLAEKVSEGVSEGVSRLLDCVREQPGVKISEISQRLQVPAKTIERWIKKLRDENRVVFKGAPKTGGYFLLNDQP